MTSANRDPSTRSRVIDAARATTRRTIERFALDQGAATVTRPGFRGSDRTVTDVNPIAGLRAAHEVELGARYVGRDYIRYAREAGYSWDDIGTALNLNPDREAGETIADAAFTYAAGRPDTGYLSSYGRTVIWTCKSCDQLISETEPCNGPADDELGHADGCTRLAAAIRRREAEWEAGQ